MRGFKTLDLHGLRHHEVEIKLENFVYLNQDEIPLIIICGNSSKMTQIVTSTLKKNNISYRLGEGLDYGRIVIDKI